MAFYIAVDNLEEGSLFIIYKNYYKCNLNFQIGKNHVETYFILHNYNKKSMFFLVNF